MLRYLLILGLLGCTSDATESDASGPDAGSDAHTSDAAITAASCMATLTVDCAASCAATVTVIYQCDPATQIYDWTRIGVRLEPGGDQFIDTAYRCEAPIVATWTISCSSTIMAGATADHPQTRADFGCVTPIVPACN